MRSDLSPRSDLPSQNSLTPEFETELARLRQKGRTQASLANTLEKRWHEANDDETRARVLRSARELARPSRARYFVVAAVLVPLLLVSISAVSNHRYEESVRSGVRAVAEVQRLGEGFCWFGSKTSDCIELELTVYPTGPSAEGAAFDAKITYDLPHRWLSRVQPGSFIYVSVDSDNERTVRLDEEAFTLRAPTRP